ncbi:MAG: tyrosine-protein phosphatase, partial [Clostridia bacterium]|nr:tyrosine-protein phosphatase [Clostridia bacterium]
ESRLKQGTVMEKVHNFRDLGGIRTADGCAVKKGLFFRSAMLNDATHNDIEYLKSLDLKVIFAYRDTDELTIVKTDPYAPLGVKHYNYPTDMQNRQLYKLKRAPVFFKAFHKVTFEDIKSTYRNIPFNNIGYKKMVEALQKGEVPFLQHCTAGKDRAGMGVAILLMILGAPYEEILKDYMKSLEIKTYIEAKVGRFIPKFIRGRMLKRYEPLFVVHECLLEAAHIEIISRYNTVDNYLLKEFNLNEPELKRLRETYTEKIS